jgi:hypothetical protein
VQEEEIFSLGTGQAHASMCLQVNDDYGIAAGVGECAEMSCTGMRNMLRLSWHQQFKCEDRGASPRVVANA